MLTRVLAHARALGTEHQRDPLGTKRILKIGFRFSSEADAPEVRLRRFPPAPGQG